MGTAKFTAEQRRELLEMTVPPRKGTKDQQRHRTLLLPAQIDELENTALPSVVAFLRRQPQLTYVRNELDAVAKAMQSADRAIGALLGGSPTPLSTSEVPPKHAARARVLMASFEAAADGDVLDKTRYLLSAAIHVVEAARKTLPAAATRHRSGESYPIGLIDRALLNGFCKAHRHWPGTAGPGAATPLPPYEIKRSYAPNSDYRRIVEICYEVAGLESSGERAIRAFMREQKRRTEPPIES